jgi:hypothetical protein
MSKFSEAVMSKLEKIAVSSLKAQPDGKPCYGVSQPSVPQYILSAPPDLTAQAVIDVLDDTKDSIKEFGGYSPNQLLRADSLLDKLRLLETPDENYATRLYAIRGLIELNKKLGGKEDLTGHDDLLAVMAEGIVIPLFFKDLSVAFETMQTFYKDRGDKKDFEWWCGNYFLRDCIRPASVNIVKNYGVPYQKEIHKDCFGFVDVDKKAYALPGVSTEEFVKTICSKFFSELGDSSSHCIYMLYDECSVRGGEKDWRTALDKGFKGKLTGS